jgi:kinesin family member C2/C3
MTTADDEHDDNAEAIESTRRRPVAPPAVPSSSPGGLSRAFTGSTFGNKINESSDAEFIPYGAYKEVVSNASALESERYDLKRRLEILTTTTKAMHSSVKRTLMAKIKTKDEYIERCLQLVRDFHPETMSSKSVLEAELSSILQKSRADSIAAEKVGVAIIDNDNDITESPRNEDGFIDSTALATCRAKLEWSEKRNKSLKIELKRFGSFHDEVAHVLKQPLTSDRWNIMNEALLRAENGTVLVDDDNDESDDNDENEVQRARIESTFDGISKGAETRLSTSLSMEASSSQSVLAKKELQVLKETITAERLKNSTLSKSIEDLTDKIDDLEEKLATALSKVKALTVSVSDASSKTGASSQERESLLSELAAARNEAKAARELVSSLTERLEDEKEVGSSLKNRLEGEQERGLFFKDEAGKLKAILQNLEASSKGSLSIAESDLSSLRTQNQGLQTKIIELEKSLASKQAAAEADVEKVKAMSKAQLVKLQKQANDQFEALKSLAVKEKEDAVRFAEQQVRSFTLKFSLASREVIELKKQHASLKAATNAAIETSRTQSLTAVRDLFSRAAPAIDGYQTAMVRLRVEMAERRRLFNLVQELRGNIRVICRVRPPVASDSGSGEIAVSFPNFAAQHEEGVHEEINVVNNNRTMKSWEFDSVFQPSASNKDVFNAVEALVTSVADGFNVCIFAYGQTGSGKTHTMEGTSSNPGINFRTLEALFALKAARSREVTCTISVSLLEIYNEQLRDMMVPAASKGSHPEPLTMRDSGGIGGVTIPGLTSVSVSTHEEVLHLMATAYKNRTTFSTNMNEHSSRSHCVLSIVVSSFNKVTNTTLKGKLHLIDLAGSERVGKSGATGDRLKEAQAINKSLSALGDVIQARAEKKSHIPFRNSVLTHLLSDSLSGDAKTLMLVNVSPSLLSSEETFCSLNFAARVRSVELGQAKKNVHT